MTQVTELLLQAQDLGSIPSTTKKMYIIYTHTHTHTHIYIYMYTQHEYTENQFDKK
jgi:hypothetical protein